MERITTCYRSFLKVHKGLVHIDGEFQYFLSTCFTQNSWSLVGRLVLRLLWYSPMIVCENCLDLLPMIIICLWNCQKGVYGNAFASVHIIAINLCRRAAKDAPPVYFQQKELCCCSLSILKGCSNWPSSFTGWIFGYRYPLESNSTAYEILNPSIYIFMSTEVRVWRVSLSQTSQTLSQSTLLIGKVFKFSDYPITGSNLLI